MFQADAVMLRGTVLAVGSRGVDAVAPAVPAPREPSRAPVKSDNTKARYAYWKPEADSIAKIFSDLTVTNLLNAHAHFEDAMKHSRWL